MTKSEIATIIIAIYGAVLSTIAIVRQFFSERVKVELTVQKNMQMVGHPRYAGMTLIVVTITNIGHRPVTIVSFGEIRLQPNTNFAGMDSNPQLPCELTEGKYVTSYWNQDDLDFSTIDYWTARDSRGKEYRLYEASRWQHWKSVRYMKREWKKQKVKSVSSAR
jgi:hypothetical protein